MNKNYSLGLLLSSGLLLGSGTLLADGQGSQLNKSVIDDKTIALQALTNMSEYLRALDKFTVHAQIYVDETMNNGQKLQLSKSVVIKAIPPSKLWAKTITIRGEREFFFDGKTFTINSPKLGYYASFKAPETIRETVLKAKQKYALDLPLSDLFSWGTDADSSASIDEAMIVGIDKVNGISCNLFAFREQEIDWQLCIQRGDMPLPLKLVIVSKQETSQPQFMAVLKWDTAPALDNQSYTFIPGSADHKINLSEIKTDK